MMTAAYETRDANHLVIPVQTSAKSNIIMLRGHSDSIDHCELQQFQTIWPLVDRHLRENYSRKITQLLLVTDCTIADLYLRSINEAFEKCNLSSAYQLFSYAIPPGTVSCDDFA